MYIFNDAVTLNRSIGSQWEHEDISDIIVYDIFNNYIKVYIVLTDSDTGLTLIVDLDSLKTEFSGYSGVLSELLLLLAGRTLETVDSLPDTNLKHVKYSDAVRSQYKLSLVNAGQVTPPNYPRSELLDVELKRPKYDTDMSLLHSHCLVSVNGFYHMTDTDGSRAYIYKASESLRKSNHNHVGITSFLDVGRLTKIPLDESRITGDGVTGPLSDKIYFNVDEELDGKSLMLVLGGYLVFPTDKVFWRNGQNSLALDLNKLPYVERLFESSKYINLNDLGLTEYSQNPDALSLTELWSDDVIKKYLTLSQSYLVTIDIPNLYANKIHARHSSVPGMFTTYQDPVSPLFSTYGKLLEYWKTQEDGHWAVNVEDSFLRNYILSFQANDSVELVTDNLLPMKPFDHSRAHLLDIIGHF